MTLLVGHNPMSKVTDVEVSAFSECFLFLIILICICIFLIRKMESSLRKMIIKLCITRYMQKVTIPNLSCASPYIIQIRLTAASMWKTSSKFVSPTLQILDPRDLQISLVAQASSVNLHKYDWDKLDFFFTKVLLLSLSIWVYLLFRQSVCLSVCLFFIVNIHRKYDWDELFFFSKVLLLSHSI